MQRWIAQNIKRANSLEAQRRRTLYSYMLSNKRNVEQFINACWMCYKVLTAREFCVYIVYATGGVSLCIVTALGMILIVAEYTFPLHLHDRCFYMGKTKHCSVLLWIFPTPNICLFNWVWSCVVWSCVLLEKSAKKFLVTNTTYISKQFFCCSFHYTLNLNLMFWIYPICIRDTCWFATFSLVEIPHKTLIKVG